jgi:hypothetical protein
MEVMMGKSIRQVSRTKGVARSTCKRWFARLKEQFRVHRDALARYFSFLGSCDQVSDFWQSCCEVQKIALSTAMFLCQHTGVSIP